MVRYTFVNLYNESLSYKLHLYSIPYLSGLSPNRHAKPDCGRVRFSPQSNGPNMPHGCSFPQPTCINIYGGFNTQVQQNAQRIPQKEF